MHFYKNRKVLITGGASFIGSHLVDRLLDLQARVTVVDDLSSGRLENLKDSMARIKFYQGDLRQQTVAKEVMQGQEIVFHLANIHGGRGFIDSHPGEIVQNFLIDGNIFYMACQMGVNRICFTSSACVYPITLQEDPAKIGVIYLEESMADPFVPGKALADREYGWAKLMAEMSLRAYHQQFGLKGVSCRLFSVYGPRENESHSIIALIGKALLKQDPYEIWGSGQQNRNFTYVSDIIEGLLLATEKITDCRAVNIGGNEFVKIADAARLICDLVGHRPKEFFFDTSKPEGVHTRVASTENQQKWLSFKPKVSFIEGLKNTIDWYIKNVDLKLLKKELGNKLFERK